MKTKTHNNNIFKSLILFVKQKLGWIGSPKIVPFIGFGNKNTTYISGLVIENNGLEKPREGQSKWKNFVAMVRRYFSNEMEFVRVKINYMDRTEIATTDKFGIFRCVFHHPDNLNNKLWQKIEISLADEPGENFSGEVMIIKDFPQFGVISDIDDTILVSYAAKKLTKLRLLLLNNAYSRMPFEGVSAFYNALQKGFSGKEFNPIFYVSNSDWNLYDLLYEFIEFNRIPKGPLLLREMAIRIWRPWNMKLVNKNHKKEVISQLFRMFPNMKFILIGDSGQKDAEIYSEIAQAYKGRIPAIYIRDVGIHNKEIKIKIFANRLKSEFKTEMLLVKDTEAAAMHALKKGFIAPETLSPILKEKQKDIQKKNQSFMKV